MDLVSSPPPFLQIANARLHYNWGAYSWDHPLLEPTIEEKCELFIKHLQHLKPMLICSNFIFNPAVTNEFYPNSFCNYSQIIDHIRNVFNIIGSVIRGFSITLNLHTFILKNYSQLGTPFSENVDAARSIISTLLMMPPFDQSHHLEIVFAGLHLSIELPIDDISNWLNRSPNKAEIKSENRQAKLLEIEVNPTQNLREISNYFVKVCFCSISFVVLFLLGLNFRYLKRPNFL